MQKSWSFMAFQYIICTCFVECVFLLVSTQVQVTRASCHHSEGGKSYCVYNLWYFWFTVVIGVLFLLTCIFIYVRTHLMKRGRVGARTAADQNRLSIHGRAKSPPPYGTPSRQPPSYDEVYPHTYYGEPSSSQVYHTSAYNNPAFTPGTQFTNHAPVHGINPASGSAPSGGQRTYHTEETPVES